MFREDLRFGELVNFKEWQKIQDSLSDAFGFTLKAVSLNGKLVSKISHPNRLCNEIVTKISDHCDFCKYLLKTGEKPPIEIKEKTNFKCPLGCDIFVIPIKAVGDKIVAYIVVGPLILTSRKPTSEYAKYAKKLGIKAEDLIDALIEINVFTHSKIYSINKLIEDIFSHVVQAGYHKKRLGEIAPEVVQMDPLFSRYYEEKILNGLLNSCTLALDADSGSVMILDKKTNMLHVKVSSKLDKDITDNTNIKAGEGIAGFAMANAEPLILPKDGNKNGLSKKLKRKYIKSSMVVPFDKGKNNKLRGVINLNMIRKDRDFSERDIALIKELANLASIALVPLRASNEGHNTD